MRNKPIKSTELADGFLFFPDLNEAKSVSELRISLKLGTEQRLLPLAQAQPVK